MIFHHSVGWPNGLYVGFLPVLLYVVVLAGKLAYLVIPLGCLIFFHMDSHSPVRLASLYGCLRISFQEDRDGSRDTSWILVSKTCLLYHILLVKANHKASSDLRSGSIDSTSWLEEALKNSWQHLSTTCYLLGISKCHNWSDIVTWVTLVGRIMTPQRSTS